MGAWLWVLLLVVVVAGLAWYALSRGEPQDISIPDIDAPSVEIPAPEQTIEINVPESEAEPTTEPAPTSEPEAPAEQGGDQP